MKTVPSWPLRLVAFVAVLFAACDTPGVTLVDPDVSNPGDKGTTIHVTLEDSALAEALGWSQGVPNAEVQLHRMIEAFQPDLFQTDSTGHVHVPERLPGYHLVAAFKSITADKAAAAGGVPRAFADGLKTEFLGNTLQLALGSDQRGSMVISETYSGGHYDEIGYRWAAFWELYNNSDTTVYLDGMLLGRAFGNSAGAIYTCDELRPVREHPQGLVAFDFHQFPGSGQEHPVAPGQAVLIALDAVDHSQAHPSLPDLTIADYELEGSGDPDNPDVPNVPPAGLNTDILGHGMQQFEQHVKFLALPVDPASLTTIPFGRYRWSVVPRDRIIDVQHAQTMHPETAPLPVVFYPCPRWVNREFDRLEAASQKSYDEDNSMALHRRILRYTSDGRAILQDTNVSYFDFVVARYSPGRIEY
jgi:hypothetical protein